MEEIKVLLDKQTIQKRIEELGEQISKDYQGKEIVILCVLKGAAFFTIDLAKQIQNQTKFEFIKVSSYGKGTKSCGKVVLQQDLEETIEGKHVLIVEDIIDTGICMRYLLEHIKEKKPASVKVASLLSKPERREIEIPIDYLGFEIPNRFVVGYGLDIDEAYRNLPYIGYIET